MDNLEKENNLDLILDNSLELSEEELRSLLNKLSSSEIAHALESSPPKQRKLLFSLLETNEEGDVLADIVYGSRFIGSDEKRVLFFWHTLGNKFLTLLSNVFTNLNLTDMENCYKVFRSNIIKNIELKENRFGFEPEITAKISKKDFRIYEVGVKYYGRKYKDGKKITWKDGFSAIRCIILYSLFK